MIYQIKLPYRKNSQREEILLKHWRRGDTVKTASLLTGIPEGSISYYYKRFNKNSDKYVRLVDDKYQEPPWSKPFDVAAAVVSTARLDQDIMRLFRDREYAKARDYMEAILLYMDLKKRLATIMGNANPKEKDDVLKSIIDVVKAVK